MRAVAKGDGWRSIGKQGLASNRPVAHVARDLGVPAETLRRFARRVEADEGLRPDLPTATEREEITRLRRENFELRRANGPRPAKWYMAGSSWCGLCGDYVDDLRVVGSICRRVVTITSSEETLADQGVSGINFVYAPPDG